MSPEQCRGSGSIDARADIYAAGVVLYEMLSGRVPFDSEAALEVMTMQIGEPVPPLAGVPPALEQVVLRALAKPPDERYESAAQMLAAFESACRTAPDWNPSAGRATQASPRAGTVRDTGSPVWATSALADRPRRGKWWLLAVAAGAGAGLLALKVREHPRQVVAPITAPAPSIVQPPPPPPQPSAATVRVSLQPAGRVFLDDQLVGTGTEVAIRDVPFGPHVLRTEAAGYLPAQRTLTVSEPLAVAIVLKPRRPAHKPSAKHARPGRQESDVEAPINPYQR
jgi:serine/threonine-protein kinase